METPDDTTIHIQLSERNEAFLSFLTTNRASIVPQDYCEAAGHKFGKTPIGTGPFRLKGHEQGIWILEAFPAYFQGRGFLDRVEVWTLPIREHRGIEDGQQPFQVMHNVRISDLNAAEWQQVRQSGVTCKFITFNEMKEGLFTNADMRAALDFAIDRSYLLDKLSGDVIVTGESFRTRMEAPLAHRPKALAEIKENLNTAGYRGETVKLATIPQYEADAELIRQVCERAGISVDIMLIPAEEFMGEARMAADMLLFAIMLDEHRELRLVDLYKSMQQHASDELQSILDRVVERILAEPDAKDRAKLFEQIENQLKERHSLLFLYRKHLKTAFHPSVRGISLESLGWVRFRDIWFT
jgi:MarR-like DNA-binding transcriptional regulator SgrR of sgrS sRNA